MRGIDLTQKSPRENLRVVADRFRETYYQVERGAGDGALLGTAAFFYRPAGRFSYVFFPDGATTAWAFPIKVKGDWNQLGLRWTIWYTSDVGATTTFGVTFAGAPYGAAGDNAAALGDLFATSYNIPGPTVAEDLLTHTSVQTTNLLGTYRPWISLRLVRAGGSDANPNELHVYSTLVEVFGRKG